MKKVGVLVLLVSISLTYFLISTKPVFATPGVWSANGSNIFYTDGNIGIGTTSPTAKLQVNGKAFFSSYGETEWVTGNSLGRIDNNYFGINDYFSFSSNFNRTSATTGTVDHPVLGTAEITLIPTNNGMGQILFRTGAQNTVPSTVMAVNGQNVGIGTTNPTNKLSVNGTILAKEVIVSNAASYWPDYVFEDNYPLMSLDDLKKYLEDSKHLPNVPDENEVEKNGVSLGEMQRLQMEKIEELTLYVLQLNQRIETLEKENQNLKMNQ